MTSIDPNLNRPFWRANLTTISDRFVQFEAQPVCDALGEREHIRIFDVGANVGLWSKAMFRILGDRIKHIWLVEPQARNIEELSNREDPLVFAPQELERTTVLPVAAGAAVSVQPFYADIKGSPLGSLYQQDDLRVGKLSLTESVQVVTIDLLLHILRIPRLDVLKIDAEGADFEVLKGAESALRRGLVDIIQFEFGETALLARVFVRDFWELLHPLGYEFYLLGRKEGSTVVPIPSYHPSWERFAGNPTFLACHADRAHKLKAS